jgi:hypothetical protein
MKTLTELQDEQLIERMGGDMCDVPLKNLRSPSMKSMWKSQCEIPKKKKQKQSMWSKAAQRAAGGRGQLYNSVEEGQLDQNLVDLMSKPINAMVKAAQKGKWKEVLAYYKELGRIIK